MKLTKKENFGCLAKHMRLHSVTAHESRFNGVICIHNNNYSCNASNSEVVK